MTLNLRWASESEDDLDRVGLTRMQCYASASRELDEHQKGLRAVPRNRGADLLLAEDDGVPVGTATGLHMTLWARGGPVPCQGVAWVGTVKTHRRRATEPAREPAGSAGGPSNLVLPAGVATQIMRAVVRKARDRGQVVSALMPFRASFYEHFGYGLVERRHEWTLPLAVLPPGDFRGVRFYTGADLAALTECRQRIVERGQCDIERSTAMWEFVVGKADDGFFVVDRPGGDAGPVRGWAWFKHSVENGRDVLRLPDFGYADVPSLMRLLNFLGSLRDQYASATVALPADVPLNRLLREAQVPHRPVSHATADVKLYTRMQVRVLDHRKFIEAMHLPPDARGRATVAVREKEGHVSRFAVDVADGRARVTDAPAAGDARFECTDVTWAAVACGDLTATAAATLGLADCKDPAAAAVLDVFARGPAPYCGEYF